MESFNEKLRDELLSRKLFLLRDELWYIVDRWRMDDNHYRPDSSLGNLSPQVFARRGIPSASVTPRPPEYRTAA